MTRIANRTVLPLALIILDGWGHSERKEFNAVANADAPNLKELLSGYPRTLLQASGEAVGLPEGIIGNSEVGHICMGAGRVVYQDLTRINKAIEQSDLDRNEVLLGTLAKIRESGGRLHLMGLLSDGGVHSHIGHLKALVRLARRRDVPEILIHVFTDGRDTPPHSGAGYLKDLEGLPEDGGGRRGGHGLGALLRHGPGQPVGPDGEGLPGDGLPGGGSLRLGRGGHPDPV